MKWIKDDKILFGHVGEKIKIFQSFLNEEFGFNLDEDGYFGEKTLMAVKKLKDKVQEEPELKKEGIKPVKEFKNTGVINIVNKLPRKRIIKTDINRKIGIVIHHSYTDSHAGGSKPEAYANYHVNTLGWPCIGYDRVIQPHEGIIYKTANLEDKNYHSGSTKHKGDENAMYYGICVSGNYDKEEVTSEIYDLVFQAIEDIIRDHKEQSGNETWRPVIFGHCHFSSKTCPGKKFDINKIMEVYNGIFE